MQLDIRLPIGMLFATLGCLLTLYGLAGDSAIYERSLGININLWWGLVMLAFGIIMVLFGRRHSGAVVPSTSASEDVSRPPMH